MSSIVYKVVLRKKAKADLNTLPKHIIAKLVAWINAVVNDGLSDVRRIYGYHDEPLKGERKGQRSIRLSKSYRAIYIINTSGAMEVIEIIEVNKHDY